MIQSRMSNPFLMPKRYSNYSSLSSSNSYSGIQPLLRKPGFLIKMDNYQSDVYSSPLMHKPSPFQTGSTISHNNYHENKNNPFQRKRLLKAKQIPTISNSSQSYFPSYYHSYYEPTSSVSSYNRQRQRQPYFYNQPNYFYHQPNYDKQFERSRPTWNSEKNIEPKEEEIKPHYFTNRDNYQDKPHDMSFSRKKLPTQVYTSVNLDEGKKNRAVVRSQQYTSEANGKGGGVFADLYKKFKNQSQTSKQILNKQNINSIYEEIYEKVKDSISINSLKKQSQQQRSNKIRNIFSDLMNKLQKQYQTNIQNTQLADGRKSFTDVYQKLQKIKSVKQADFANEDQFLKSKAIFGEVYGKMYSAGLIEKRQGEVDQEKYDQGKRLFTQVCNRIINRFQQEGKPPEEKKIDLNLQDAIRTSIEKYAYQQKFQRPQSSNSPYNHYDQSNQLMQPLLRYGKSINMNYPAQLTYQQKIFCLI